MGHKKEPTCFCL